MTESNQNSDRQERARRRGTWPVRRTTLDDDGRAELLAATTPEERIAMMDELSREAWTLAGRPYPIYDRKDAPIRRTTLEDA